MLGLSLSSLTCLLLHYTDNLEVVDNNHSSADTHMDDMTLNDLGYVTAIEWVMFLKDEFGDENEKMMACNYSDK